MASREQKQGFSQRNKKRIGVRLLGSHSGCLKTVEVLKGSHFKSIVNSQAIM